MALPTLRVTDCHAAPARVPYPPLLWCRVGMECVGSLLTLGHAVSTRIGPGELLCPICRGSIGPDFECVNGHTLFEIGNSVKELEFQLDKDKILTDEPLGLRELGCSTVTEQYGNVDYQRATVQYETAETKTPVLLTRRDVLAAGIAAIFSAPVAIMAARTSSGLPERAGAEYHSARIGSIPA